MKNKTDKNPMIVFALGAETATVVEQDGVPVAWRLLKLGDNQVTQNGVSYNIILTDEMLDAIIAHYMKKGEQIPLDSEHMLFLLAEKLNVTEAEIAKLIGNRATFAWGSLEKRADGLWVKDVKYLPLAKKIIAEKVLRWFSPVVRGFSDGSWRVTSVTFTNVPAFDKLDAIAATAEETLKLDFETLTKRLDALALSAETKKENLQMKKLLVAVTGLLGVDAIALSAENDVDDNIIDKLNAVKKELDAGKTFRTAMSDVLALSAENDFTIIEGAVRGLASKAKTADDLKVRVDALALESETRKRDDLISQGLQHGKLTKDMAENWAKKQDAIALSAYLDNAPVIIPLDKINRDKLPEGDAIALTAEDREVCRLTGISEEDFLKSKKGA